MNDRVDDSAGRDGKCAAHDTKVYSQLAPSTGRTMNRPILPRASDLLLLVHLDPHPQNTWSHARDGRCLDLQAFVYERSCRNAGCGIAQARQAGAVKKRTP